ncbi:MAG: YidC/Oxa1 family insertase periplasmic-domain containing protein, partial [Christiangramia sp.]|nr:YidC/Oxa1 family insertase periplasmic-domain containing protein [Christiangramia sp.]
MEEKKIDVQSIIGFLLIGAILIWMLYNNTPEETATEDTKTEQVEEASEQPQVAEQEPETRTVQDDSTALADAQRRLGAFGYSETLASSEGGTTTIENELLELKISNKGGYIEEARLKNYKTFDSIPVHLIKDGNASLNMNFTTTDGRSLNTENLYFEPELTENNGNQILSMKLKVSEDEYLEYRYAMRPGEYMLD